MIGRNHAIPLIFLSLASALLTGCMTTTRKTTAILGVRYWAEQREKPRPLVLHFVRIDLQRTDHELAVAVTDDPDGTGPDEALLVTPLEIAADHQMRMAVNTNAFQVRHKSPLDALIKYPAGATVDIIGLAAEDGALRSPAQKPYVAFWLDERGRPHLGQPDPAKDTVVHGCAGFNWLVVDGKNVGAEGDRHPRTAIGLESTGRFVYLLVVDGRQPGYSEGMTTRELAVEMLALGCDRAVNLDGGGSSVLILPDAADRPAIINRPSTTIAGRHMARPLPVMLGLRPRR